MEKLPATLCAPWGVPCGSTPSPPHHTEVDLGKLHPRGVQEKKFATFFPGGLSTEKCTGMLRGPVEKGAAPHRGAVFSPYPERAVATPRPRSNPAAGDPADCLRPSIGLGYPSRVCSTTGDAIDRIVDAIDQLANDAQGEASARELAARVADLWMMVSALDPELARRRQGYTTPADGAPSA